MLVARPFIALVVLWTLIHGFYYLFKPSRPYPLLPSVSTPTSRRRRGPWNSPSTQIVLKNVHLRIQTTACNSRHDVLTAMLQKEWRISWTLRWFYDLGCLLGVLAMLAGLGGLLWTCGQGLYVLTQNVVADSYQAPDLVRRAITSHIHGPNLSQERKSFIKAIIPGVTVPFGHLPLILSSVFLAQIVHEFGHAIAASLESLPILSAGVAFTLVIPSAFVTFPATALEVLSPRARARVISAGPFHNIFFWMTLLLVQNLGFGRVFWSIGYKDVSDMGRVVVNVDAGSPLYAHLPPGSVVTMLDDTPLGLVGASGDAWTAYLTGLNPDQGAGLGWCTEHVLEEPEQCCDVKSAHGFACFVSGDSKRRRCLDPVPILTAPGGRSRCNVDSDCVGNFTCARPDEINKLLRLSLRKVWPHGVSEVVLWSGPLEEVWEEVRVGDLLPRLGVVPVWLPHEAELFWQYLLMGTLSLFFFNLLPLPHLDGSQFLQTILQVAFDDDRDDALVYDIEALEATQDRQNSRRRGRWKDRLSRAIPHVTIGLFVLCVLLEVMNILW